MFEVQCKAYRPGIQTDVIQRTRTIQNYGKQQIETPIGGRTHILATWQE